MINKPISGKFKSLFQVIFPHKLLFFLFLLSLIIRIAFVTLFAGNKGFLSLPIPDQIIHHHIAININKGEGLTLPGVLLSVPDDSPRWVRDKFLKWQELGGFWGVVPVDRPQTSFPPVHPLYLALVYWIFGPNPIASRIIQAFISAISSIILYHLTRKCLDQITALITYIISIF